MKTTQRRNVTTNTPNVKTNEEGGRRREQIDPFALFIAAFPLMVALALFRGLFLLCLLKSHTMAMKIFGLQITGARLWPVLFHLVLWSLWIGLPLVNSANNSHFQRFMIAMIPINLGHIPLFLLNSEWLIPQVFRKRSVPVYLLSLLLLIAVFSVVHLLLKEWIMPDDLMRRHWDVFWAVVPVVFVTAISTGYGFMTFLLKQERARREEQQERLQSELSFLRSQISPHFIFNVLNSIVYLIRSQSQLAEHVTIKLSELMRYMLYESNDAQVPLDREIDYLRNYVELQKIRFEEDVDIRLHIEGEADIQPIEPMLLIPFVENAFKHGVGMIEAPFIDIFLKIAPAELKFEVRNKISDYPEEDKDSSSGIGLKNVRRRLELLYPHQHRLQASQEGDTYIVKLSLQLSNRSANIAGKPDDANLLGHETPLHSRR